MKSCRDIEEIMAAYVDGETTIAEDTAVASHLEACPNCGERVARERTVRQVVRAKADALGERASPGLRARCVAACPDNIGQGAGASVTAGGTRSPGVRTLRWVPLSAVAMIVLVAGTALMMGQNSRLQAAFVAQLAKDHDKCFAQVDRDPTFDTAGAEAQLARDFGLIESVPAENESFDLIAIRRCEYDRGYMAHLLCEWNGQPVSLFIVPGRHDRELRTETMGHDAVVWSDDRTEYALVAEQGPVEMTQLVQYVRQWTD